MRFQWNFSLKMKILIKTVQFGAKGCVKEQSSRKNTPLRIQFYSHTIINLPIETFSNAWQWHRFDVGFNFTHFYLVTSNLLPNFLMAVTHSFFNIMVSVIPLDKNVGCELHKEVELKAYRKIYVALRAVYYFPFIKNNPVHLIGHLSQI